MRGPLVDVVVPLHDVRRRYERSVRSALAGTEGRVRVNVVCHNIDAGPVEETLHPLGPAVRVLELDDGVPSPSGPFNAGLDAATAPFVAIQGSDDYLEDGALRAWVRAAGDSQVVLAPMRHESGEPIATPRARPWRRHRLDMVKDGLAYRTAPLGLLDRELLDRHGLRMTPGLRSGVDVEFSARLWTVADRVGRAAGAPRYVVAADAPSRVTTAVRPVAQELSAWEHLIDQAWFAALPADRRRAVATKALRIHILAAARRRTEAGQWRPGEAPWLGDLASRWSSVAPAVVRPLSRADRALLDVLTSGAGEADVAAAARLRAAAGRLDQVLAAETLGNLERDSTLRHYARVRLEGALARADRYVPASRST